MKRKRDNDGRISVIAHSNRHLIILNPKQDVSIVSIRDDSKISYKLPTECCDNYPNEHHLAPLVSDNSISKFVYSKKNQIYVLAIEEDLIIQNFIKSRAAILSVISGRFINNDWYVFTLSAHEKIFRLELRLSKNLEIIEMLNIACFDDHIELLDSQFVHEDVFQPNFDVIFILYRIKNDIKFALISVTSKKLTILRHYSFNDKLNINVDNFFSYHKYWFFSNIESSTLIRAAWDCRLLDFTFEKYSNFDGSFFISHEIWGKYTCTSTSITVQLFKIPNNNLMDEKFPINHMITNVKGGIDETSVLLLLFHSNDDYQTLNINADNFNNISSASLLQKAILSFNTNHLIPNDLSIENARKTFQIETLRDEDAVKILLKDPELLLPLFVESFNISSGHLTKAFKKHLTQKSFDILIKKLLEWINAFNNGTELAGLSEACNFDHLVWIKIIELTCCILDSTVNPDTNEDGTNLVNSISNNSNNIVKKEKIIINEYIAEELIKLTKDVCKLQKILQHMYSRVIMLTSASHFHDSRKYNSNKLLETFSIDI